MAQQASWVDVLNQGYKPQYELPDLQKFVQSMYNTEKGTSQGNVNPFATQEMGQEHSYMDTSNPAAQRYKTMQNWLNTLNQYKQMGKDPNTAFSNMSPVTRMQWQGQSGLPVRGADSAANMLFQNAPDLKNQFFQYLRTMGGQEGANPSTGLQPPTSPTGQTGVAAQPQGSYWSNMGALAGWNQPPTAQPLANGQPSQTTSTAPQNMVAQGQPYSGWTNMLQNPAAPEYKNAPGSPLANMWMQTQPMMQNQPQGSFNPYAQAGQLGLAPINRIQGQRGTYPKLNPYGEWQNTRANKLMTNQYYDWQGNHPKKATAGVMPPRYQGPQWSSVM
jgi:hypothetical protein